MTFKEYMELVQVEPNPFNSLKDELGIDPEDAQDALFAAHINPGGKFTYSGITYHVTKWAKDHNGIVSGAWVQPISTSRAYAKDSKGRMIRMPNQTDTEERFIKVDDLTKMMNQSANTEQPQGQLPGMSSMGGLG